MPAVISSCGWWCYSNSILHITQGTERAKILCWRLKQINAQWLDEFTVAVQSCAVVRCKLCAELVKSCACRVTSSGVLTVLVVKTEMWVNRRKTSVLWFCIWCFSCDWLMCVSERTSAWWIWISPVRGKCTRSWMTCRQGKEVFYFINPYLANVENMVSS